MRLRAVRAELDAGRSSATRACSSREHRRLSEHYPLELRVALAPLVELLAEHIAAATDTADPRRDAETMFRVILQGIDDVVVGRVSDADEHAEYLWHFCWGGLAHGRQ